MGKCAMQAWREKMWMPYVEEKSNSVLLLYRVQLFLDPDFTDSVSDTYT